ncbi:MULTISPECIES: AraC family transcriptional regulator [unclassified Actinopolyspora]|uniref:helix-turn-helix domain-containing protein n=1 Tax=unclassified Actinopolyspora TaxID=2639451 RepID=UPI0013F61EA5|nr:MULTISPECIES: AraC family transcriptional regulator [unclassified Actinopolyspora]NHD16743.1 AraC family transcriptional regulator [Actinopolyspora sp. BKK2]NHE75394.1 AraC family transcriptional regulator [Actinopolyspora sp. BKK1]
MVTSSGVAAWRPPVGGIAEVYHAHLVEHSYPMHAHDSWTLLLVDDGTVRYDLHRHEHGALGSLVTLLPPHVPHNGTPMTPQGLRKRVLYLDSTRFGEDLVGAAVDDPTIDDPLLRHRIHQLHDSLLPPGEPLEAESRLAFVTERLRLHLTGRPGTAEPVDRAKLAVRLRELLDEHLVDGLTLREAADVLHAHPTHLVRAFSGEFATPPHQYLTGRRVDLARRLLLGGMAPRFAATAAGFYDQAHLTRHFKRVLGTSPARFARG